MCPAKTKIFQTKTNHIKLLSVLWNKYCVIVYYTFVGSWTPFFPCIIFIISPCTICVNTPRLRSHQTPGKCRISLSQTPGRPRRRNSERCEHLAVTGDNLGLATVWCLEQMKKYYPKRWIPRDVGSPCQMMIGVYNHLRNARYLGSISILKRWLDP